MKISYPQLENHLLKNLAALYFICGEELLLQQEAQQQIITAAKTAGFMERVRITPETGSEWEKLLYEETHSLSLFASKRIVELDLRASKISAKQSEALQNYLEKPSDNTLLIILFNKLDKKAEQSAWYKTVEKKGVVIQIWPIQAGQLPQWILQRAKKNQLNLTQAAAEKIAQQVEGNLLAAAQAIEKISLLNLTGSVDVTAVEAAITDTAQFDIFDLVDSTLLGDTVRSLRILQNLIAEGTETTLILWGLARELRVMAELAKQTEQGIKLASLWNTHRIWEKRQPAVRAFLQRHNKDNCWNLLTHAAKIDRMIKGAGTGNVHDEIQALLLKMSVPPEKLKDKML